MSGCCEIWIGGPISALAAPANTQGQAAHSYAPIRSVRLDEVEYAHIDRRTASERNGVARVGDEHQLAVGVGDPRRHRIAVLRIELGAIDRQREGKGNLLDAGSETLARERPRRRAGKSVG